VDFPPVSRWYKRCGADFIHGTMMLTLEEKGAYSLCLDLIYDRGGPIPDEARWLSGVCGVSMRKWASLRERLISLGKLAAENGQLSNSRADLELVSMELQRRNQAEAGAKGGRKRAEKQAAANENRDLAQATLKPIEEIREEEKEAEASPPSARANPFPRPEWAEEQVWRDFMANRKKRRMTNSATAYRQFLSDIARLTDDEWPPGRLLEYAAGKSWGSVNDPRPEGPRNGYSHDTRDPTTVALELLAAQDRSRQMPQAGGADFNVAGSPGGMDQRSH
jgi:uncharacterized protein YdaU (DUF1376 family)